MLFGDSLLRRRRSAATIFTALVMLASVTSAGAQQAAAPSDVLPFSSGQRGLQFTVEDNGASVGFLRFASPRAAWTFDIGGSVSRTEEETSTTFGGTTTSISRRNWVGDVTVRTGLRTHRALRAGAVGFWGAGVGGSYMRVSGQGSQTFWSGGLYGELGASYHVSPRMSFGALTGAVLSYGERRQPAGTFSATSSSAIRVSTQPARLLVAIYF